MITTQILVDFQNNYQQNLAKYHALEEEAKHILSSKIKEEQFQVHLIHSRIKELNSCILKVTEKDSVELTDIVGIRIVCLFLSDMDQIGKIISDNLNIICFDNKIASSPIDKFGYFSHHYIVTLHDRYSGPRYEKIKNIMFEIQVRTIAMDAWANISHYLSYKPTAEITDEISKELYSTSAMFYLADRNFERIFSSYFKELRLQTQKLVTATPDDLSKIEISLLNMSAFLKAKLPSRLHANLPAINNLVNDLSLAGYKTLDIIFKRIIDMRQIIEIYETERESGLKLSDVALVNTVMMISDSKFCRCFYPDIAHRKQIDKHFKKYRFLWKREQMKNTMTERIEGAGLHIS